MFGDLMGMMGKLQEAQKKVAEAKQRLDTVLIDEQSNDGLLKVTVTANNTVRSVSVSDELLQDKEQLEDYIVMVINNAIAKAAKISEAELAAAAKDGMPDIPGLF
ncbi:YbaB/EbfC family nucleoid-associated protein [Flavobacterium pallidum]|uniref:Nucleoid-associated protein HYN49_11035 n=1 Tax=Flavobacterium pallidum TaxID=2172098 RepID=A0A2S1SJ73_9FLAO|nr:YbaB/EbfC family nucleoid-associated protein [Flavobacterium pallidum]AWI26392.1 nucleoid-associated protein, YbaB/EbfC family [Flavobacterium pallidum]